MKPTSKKQFPRVEWCCRDKHSGTKQIQSYTSRIPNSDPGCPGGTQSSQRSPAAYPMVTSQKHMCVGKTVGPSTLGWLAFLRLLGPKSTALTAEEVSWPPGDCPLGEKNKKLSDTGRFSKPPIVRYRASRWSRGGISSSPVQCVLPQKPPPTRRYCLPRSPHHNGPLRKLSTRNQRK